MCSAVILVLQAQVLQTLSDFPGSFSNFRFTSIANSISDNTDPTHSPNLQPILQNKVKRTRALSRDFFVLIFSLLDVSLTAVIVRHSNFRFNTLSFPLFRNYADRLHNYVQKISPVRAASGGWRSLHLFLSPIPPQLATSLLVFPSSAD